MAFSFATFAFFAAKHQSRVGLFSAERGNAFYTIYTFYTDRICVGQRSGCLWPGAGKGVTCRVKHCKEGLAVCAAFVRHSGKKCVLFSR